MGEDRTELDDLAEKNKAQVAKMVAAYDEWAHRCGVLPWEETLARMRGR
jgi:arylsulfatase